MLQTRDPSLARRMGWSQGMVREVQRLAAVAGASRTATGGHNNPWMSQSAHIPGIRESYADALGRLAAASSRSAPLPNPTTDVAKAIMGVVGVMAGLSPVGRGLALRELLAVTTGLSGVLGQGSPIVQPEGMVVPAGWVNDRPCTGGANGPVQAGGSLGTCFDYPHIGVNPPNFQVQDFQFLANGSSAGYYDLIHTGVNYRWGWRAWYRWRGPTLSGSAAQAMAIRARPAAALGLGVSPVGMAAPAFGIRRQVEAAHALMLPNMALPSIEVPKAMQQAINQVREDLGYREEVQPSTPVLPAPKPVTQWHPQVVPGIRAETSGSRWVLSSPHRYAREAFGKTKKLKISGVAYRVFAKVMSAFTETNDWLEAIHKTLPRGERRAGTTSTGNKRTDSMIKDLYRAWDKIDWDQAIANLIANEVEDALIGQQQKYTNRLSRASGQGLGTTYGKLLDGAPTSWVENVTSFIETRAPPLIRRVRIPLGG